MISRPGERKVLDFGIAKALEESRELGDRHRPDDRLRGSRTAGPSQRQRARGLLVARRDALRDGVRATGPTRISTALASAASSSSAITQQRAARAATRRLPGGTRRRSSTAARASGGAPLPDGRGDPGGPGAVSPRRDPVGGRATTTRRRRRRFTRSGERGAGDSAPRGRGGCDGAAICNDRSRRPTPRAGARRSRRRTASWHVAGRTRHSGRGRAFSGSNRARTVHATPHRRRGRTLPARPDDRDRRGGVALCRAVPRNHRRRSTSARSPRNATAYDGVERWALLGHRAARARATQLRPALVAVGDRVIADYRREEPTMGPAEWKQAHAALALGGGAVAAGAAAAGEAVDRRSARQAARGPAPRPAAACRRCAQAPWPGSATRPQADPASFDPYLGMAGIAGLRAC